MKMLKSTGYFTTKAKLCLMVYLIAVGLLIWLIVKPVGQSEINAQEFDENKIEELQ